jgi:hypothetical protein
MNSSRKFASVVAGLVVGFGVLAGAASSGSQVHLPSTFRAQIGISDELGRASGKVEVRFTLRDRGAVGESIQSANRRFRDERQLATRVSRAARTSPARATALEGLAAHQFERAQDAERRDLAGDARENEQLVEAFADLVRRRGGEVTSASVLPPYVDAKLDAAVARRLAGDRRVDAAAVLPRTVPLVDTISETVGADVWHTNGYHGQVPSGPPSGGPDFVVDDTGVRTAHNAFAGRTPPVVSPAGRTNFNGSEHANTIAAIVAGTEDDYVDVGGPYDMRGVAYGLDKLLDEYQANCPDSWYLGITCLGEAGASDPAEVRNYSRATYNNDVDVHSGVTDHWDYLTFAFGLSQSAAAGNCGVANVWCSEPSVQRVTHPSTAYNVLSVGGLAWQVGDTTYPTGMWPNSSPGPTWGGRKKPDLVAPTTGPGPSDQNNVEYENTGQGTSYAAPYVAAAMVLLESVGVTSSLAQRAILINSARPIAGQTYWRYDSGWGALDLATAYPDRGNYVLSSVPGLGSNGVRFFRQTNTSGDRTTLAWERRMWANVVSPEVVGTYFTLTNLDLAEVDETSGATTATGGIDTGAGGDTVETTGPMGVPRDYEDNVEQIRSTSSGTKIVKVVAKSTIDGVTAEPFALASTEPLTELETPVPDVSLAVSDSTPEVGDTVSITATVTNLSSDLSVQSVALNFTAPSGTTLTSGLASENLGTIATDGTVVRNFQLHIDNEGSKSVTISTSGARYGETLGDSASQGLLVDSSGPTTSVNTLPTYSTSSPVTVSYTASDTVSSISSYDIEASHNGGAFSPVVTGTTSTSTAVSGGNGDQVTVRVRATDSDGNVGAWQQVSTTFATSLPNVAFSAAGSPVFGRPFTVNALVSGGVASYTVTWQMDKSPVVTNLPASGGPMTFTMQPRSVASLSRGEYALIHVVVTDAFGRSADYYWSAKVVGLTPALTIAKPSVHDDVTTLSGKVESDLKSVTIVAKKRGAKSLRKTVRVKRGRWRMRARLAPGRWRITASTRDRVPFKARSVSRMVRVSS